jgi:hypothetical protein
MTTKAEIEGAQAMAKSMSAKDLKWQIANAAKLGTQQLTPIFKKELEAKENGEGNMTTKTSKTRGPKEEALRAKREGKAGDIPAFLRRTETPEQAEARRAKQAKAEERKRFGESSGLTVKKPPEPVDPKIAKAIARDLKDKKTAEAIAAVDKSAEKLSHGEAQPFAPLADFVKRGLKAQKAVNEIIAKASKPAKSEGELIAHYKGIAQRSTKKLSPLLQRAVALRQNIETQAKGTTEMPKAPTKIAKAKGKASGKGKAAGKGESLLSAVMSGKIDTGAALSAIGGFPKGKGKPAIKVAGPDLGDGPGLARLRKSKNAAKLRKENVTAQKSATALKSVAIAKPAKKKVGRASLQIADNAVITVLAKENPKRGGGAKRFDLYRSGMTFAKYVEAQKGNRSQARSDVLFDSSRDWIKLSPPPKAG